MTNFDEAKAIKESDRRYPHSEVVDSDDYLDFANRRMAFRKGAKWQASQPIVITDEMVERGAKALFGESQELDQDNSWDDALPDEWREEWKYQARNVIEAALGVSNDPN